MKKLLLNVILTVTAGMGMVFTASAQNVGGGSKGLTVSQL